MLRPVRAIVFDFGNVLYAVDYRAMARRLAGDRAEEFLRRFAGSPLQIAYETGRLGLEDLLAGMAREGFPLDRDRFLTAYLSVFSPVPGMARMLEQLSPLVPLGLLSNTSPEHAALFIEQVPEFRHFRSRVYSFEIGRMKPSPELYCEAARRLSVDPAEIVYVDDLEENMEGARAVGMQGIHFADALSLARELARRGIDLAATP